MMPTPTLPPIVDVALRRYTRRAAFLLTAVVVAGCAAKVVEPAAGTPLTVMTSGGFSSSFDALRPDAEKLLGMRIATIQGASMGGAVDSIPSRLAHGEPGDVVILARPALDQLVRQGLVISGSQVDLVHSLIGVAVRSGAPKPDISSVAAFRQALLAAPSIAYSDSASGTYYETELIARLGLETELRPKSRRIVSERVAAVVARGDAALGLQQVSELLPVPGADFVGVLPPEIQRMTVFSAGVTTSAKNPDAARRLIAFLASPAADATIRRNGLEPAQRR